MEHADHISETGAEALHGLRGQGDFRNQHNRFPSGFNGFGYRLKIDLRFARTGHAVQQNHMPLFPVFHDIENEFQRLGLFRRRRSCAGPQDNGAFEGIAVVLLLFADHKSLLHQSVQRRFSGPRLDQKNVLRQFVFENQRFDDGGTGF